MLKSNFVPVCLFTYNRLDETKRTIQALQNNYLAAHSDLYIFQDGPKNNQSAVQVKQVHDYLKTIIGFKTITILKSEHNKGLANSVIEGVTFVLEKHNNVIVLEDDLVTSPNFLDFMNQALAYYEKNEMLFSVSGWSLNLKSLNKLNSDYYFHYRLSSWGWGIWKDRWDKINWDKSYFEDFKSNRNKQKLFGKIGADMPKMLLHFLEGKNNSWAIRACYTQHELKLFTLAPKLSKVNNIGFGKAATHTKFRNRFDLSLDDTLQREFDFTNNVYLDHNVIFEYRNYFNFYKRVKAKLIDMICC